MILNLSEAALAWRSSWWLVLLCSLLGASAALGLSLLATPQYAAQTQLFVSTTDSSTTSAVFAGSQFSEQRVASYVELLTGQDLAGRVVERLDLSLSAKQLADEITASSVPGTVLINVTVTDPSPHRAYEIADAVGSEFTGLARELETPDGTDASPVKVTVTQLPTVPEAPSSPKKTRNVLVGFIVGLIFGTVGAVARVRLDRSVKDRKEAADLAGAPLIGTVVRDPALADRHVVAGDSSARVAEDFRQLRASLQFLDVDNPPKVIMVTSPMPSEGKTTVVINLALALAEAGRQVAVVEADLRRSRLTRYLGLVSGVGLTNLLAGTAELPDVIQPFGEGLISLVGAGPMPPNPSQLLASGHMSTLIEELRAKNDYVLVDAPPLLPVADATGLAPLVDGVVLSVRHGNTRKDQLQQAVATLERVGGRVLGVILNIVPPKGEFAAAYGYGYRYVEDEVSRGHRSKRGRRRAGRDASAAVSDVTS